ncbi:apolipoprotein N-acyltransferase [Magnetospirillum molischianum]|uniref:Apolipoprotein N-acyltransferase n=1 Tax=Magnetospirillum molischianum DSM 120 TaxID=1150626 RepID=H8FT05_MAGML|nr:apolipoprotein N-acyltransferase [Magnetospirillum molischianum]CCG41493.1 Apolipoprotein N-acyltransferase (ALP N-acyltransferase) [Magnetospirillum molischianum DSM 120]
MSTAARVFATARALADRFAALSGWRRRLTLVGLGAFGALALPPVSLLPVLLLSLPALVWLFDAAATRRAAFGVGWWWGWGWFIVGLYWVSYALLTDPAKFGWMIPFAVFGLSGLLAVFLGLATLTARLVGARGTGRIAVLAAAWTVAEWLRSWALTGFPWNSLGSVWDVSLPVLQFGALAGLWGLSLLTALAAMAPALLADSPSPRRAVLIGLLTIGLPLAAWGGGSWRLALVPPAETGLTLRVVQPHIPQGTKWLEERRESHLFDAVTLSRGTSLDTVAAVIWPEAAAPFFLNLDDQHRAYAALAAPPSGLLLTGALRITPRGENPFRLWNSLYAIAPGGATVAVFDKAHLVPFGEYVPLRQLLPITKITNGSTDFTPGPGPRTLTLPGLPPVAPLVCYEAIFPGQVVGHDQPRPDWILNITDDGWFGLSAGPYQHLAAARLRAVEEGLPLVRAANTGISAVFDPLGREVARLGLGERGSFDAVLPRPLAVTPYGRFGDSLPLALALACFAVGLACGKKRP